MSAPVKISHRKTHFPFSEGFNHLLKFEQVTSAKTDELRADIYPIYNEASQQGSTLSSAYLASALRVISLSTEEISNGV